MEDKKQKEILKVEGMTCANCALCIKKHLDKNGIQNVNVNFATNEASFYQDNEHNTNDIIALINELGYKAKAKNEDDKEQGISLIEKQFFFTLIFTIPLFSHMFLPKDSILQNALLQFFLCLPVFLVGVFHFGKSAFSSLKAGLPNMDVLILMGSSAAFFYSIYGWLISCSRIHVVAVHTVKLMLVIAFGFTSQNHHPAKGGRCCCARFPMLPT